VIKTFNTPLADITNSVEAHLCESHGSVIDFIEVFNTLGVEKYKIFEENYNSDAFFSEKALAFNAKVIELHESLVSEEDIPQVPQKQFIIENTPQTDISDNDLDSQVECLTLKVSSQPWVFSQEHKVYLEDLSHLLKKPIQSQVVIETPTNITSNIETVKKFDENNKIVINLESVDFSNLTYMIHQCSECEFNFTPEVNIEKYEALGHALYNQVREKVIVHDFSSDTFQIELYPERLGKVKIKCDLDQDDKVIVQVSAEKLTTLSLLQQNALELKDIINKNFSERSAETDISFTMSHDKQNHDQSRSRDQKSHILSTNEDKINTTVYFLHNGIINLTV
jgi:hypothetical protein